MVNAGFYRSFEDRFRGSREAIEQRLRAYLSFLAPLPEITCVPRALDLGCGRGEWLELLETQGFVAQGVDLDAGMLAACRERELVVRQEDAIAALAEMGDESLAVVSGFHIAEHLPFDTLQALVADALRVLAPGGLLILETPNPENILVASRHFYLDPTHRHPLPPPLLAFLPEFVGFARTRILRLQETQGVHSDVPIGVREVLGGASPDYAVVSQKSGPAPHLALFDSAFEADCGVSYESLVERFDSRFANVESRATTAQETARQALGDGGAVRSELEIFRNELEVFRSELHAVYNSRSWRVTAPLRWAAAQRRKLRAEGANARVKAATKKVFLSVDQAIATRPEVRQAMATATRRLGMYHALKPLYRRLRAVPPNSYVESQISPWARRIYTRVDRYCDAKREESKCE